MPFKELATHMQRGMCKRGYVRPADNYQFKSQQIVPAGGNNQGQFLA